MPDGGPTTIFATQRTATGARPEGVAAGERREPWEFGTEDGRRLTYRGSGKFTMRNHKGPECEVEADSLKPEPWDLPYPRP